MSQRSKELPVGGGYYAGYRNETIKLVEEGKLANSILGAEGDRSVAIWSDRFFNYDDQNWTPRITAREFKVTAKRFKKQWPNCPFSVKWLIEDFLRRV